MTTIMCGGNVDIGYVALSSCVRVANHISRHPASFGGEEEILASVVPYCAVWDITEVQNLRTGGE